jgi:hypothetical protein
LALTAFFVVRDSDDGFGCELTAAGVGLVAVGMARGRSSEAIVASLGPLAASTVCQRTVSLLVDEPNQDVTIGVDGPGAPQEVTLSGSELLRSILEAADAPTCDDWLAAGLRSACHEGRFPPPAAANSE